jgi:hypothetical protein
VKLKSVTSVAITCAFLVTSLLAQQPAQPQWKDRAEYDMFQAIIKEADPQKKLDAIKAWSGKYPESAFKKEGLTLRLSAYAQQQKFPDVIATANDILAIDPMDLTSLYWITTLTRSLNMTQPAQLELGEKSATKLLESLDQIFAAEKKPAATDAAAWAKARGDMEQLAMKTLAWISMAQKQNEKAEQRIMALIDKYPNDGEAAYWLYTVIRAQKKPERSSEALFYLARAASLPAAQGGLADAQRKQVDDFFVRAYNTYHGKDEAGIAEVRKLALASAKPPADFKIADKGTLDVEAEKKFREEFPQIFYWTNLRKSLEGAEGQAFWERMKDAALPGKIEGTEMTKLKGKLLQAKPETNPKELVLWMDFREPMANEGEVTLKLDKALRGKAEQGTEIEFEGVASGFSSDPFMVTFDVETDKLTGWPVQAPPAKKAPSKRAPSRKKK